jgi:hypothetical protein
MVTPETQDASVPAVTTTPPIKVSECRPGVYAGVFDGPVTFAVGSINAVSGTVTAKLVAEASGDALQVRDGVITGMDSTGIGMSAKWTGRLNCATKQLENGLLEAGAWENGSTFIGTLEGMYSLNPYALSGTWQVESGEIPFAGGNGKWRMTLQGSPAP